MSANTAPCLCGEPAINECAGCALARYCSRGCQVSDWPRHKTDCHRVRQARANADRVEKFHAAWVAEADRRIGGNLVAMVREYPGSDIVVRIDETIHEFTRGSSLHFAHLEVGGESAAPRAHYRLLDYACSRDIALPTAKNSSCGIIPRQWSITFDM